jgi:hypothetical protein
MYDRVQHRHQLAIGRCILAEWAPEGLEDHTPGYVQTMHRISLRDSSYFRLNKWKVEMYDLCFEIRFSGVYSSLLTWISREDLLSKIDKQPKLDKMKCIPPETL